MTHAHGEGCKTQDAGAGQVLEALLRAYRRHFDIERESKVLGVTVPALAQFHSRGERYVLTKRAKLWAMECHEFAFFFAPEVLTPTCFTEIAALLERAERELVKPHPEHMYTYLTAVILTDTIPEETRRLVRRYKWRRNYRMSLQGWCYIRVAVRCLSDHTTVTNRDGKELRKTLKAVLG